VGWPERSFLAAACLPCGELRVLYADYPPVDGPRSTNIQVQFFIFTRMGPKPSIGIEGKHLGTIAKLITHRLL